MFSANWFGNNAKSWSEWLKELKDKPDLTFLEIGCFEGRATTWLLDNILTHKSSKIHTIDTFDGNMEHKVKGKEFFENAEKNYWENIKPYGDRVITHKGRSDEILKTFPYNSFDFIYIDGSHRSLEVLEDSVLAWRLLKNNGIIVWDDYKWERYEDPNLVPKMGIDAFLQVYQQQYRLINKGYQVCAVKTV